jgi:hypothetical protein
MAKLRLEYILAVVGMLCVFTIIYNIALLLA